MPTSPGASAATTLIPSRPDRVGEPPHCAHHCGLARGSHRVPPPVALLTGRAAREVTDVRRIALRRGATANLRRRERAARIRGDARRRRLPRGFAPHRRASSALLRLLPRCRHRTRPHETFAITEIARLAAVEPDRLQLYHFRDRDRHEVDLVLERRDGAIAGVEVKAAASVRASDFRGLKLLRDRLGERFAFGVVLHTGRRPSRSATPRGRAARGAVVRLTRQTG